MSHELFKFSTKSDLNPEETRRYNELIQKSSTAQNLGLLAQVTLIQRKAHNFRRNCMLAAAPLTGDEIRIWQAWLPGHFSTLEDSALNYVGMYEYQTIPSPVLKKWKEFKDQGLFESFEIWSGVGEHQDSLLVGVNGDKYYLLARWTNTIHDVLSFEKIKRELELRWQKSLTFSGDTKYWRIDPRRYNHPDIIIGSVVFALVIPLLFEYETFLPPYTLDTAFNLTVSLGLGVASLVFSRRRIIKRMRQESPLIQAIVSDDMLKKEVDIFDRPPRHSWLFFLGRRKTMNRGILSESRYA